MLKLLSLKKHVQLIVKYLKYMVFNEIRHFWTVSKFRILGPQINIKKNHNKLGEKIITSLIFCQFFIDSASKYWKMELRDKNL